MSTKYNEEAEDLMFELFDEDDFTKVISFVDKYGCDFVDRDGRNLLMNFIVEGKSTFAIELIKQYKMNGLNLDLQDDSGWTALHFAAQENSPEIIELLAGSKANLNIQEENGRTSSLFVLHLLYPKYFIKILILPLSRSLMILFSRIWRTRSRVRLNSLPISSKPFSWQPIP